MLGAAAGVERLLRQRDRGVGHGTILTVTALTRDDVVAHDT
jgi:hypothetical protein